jgi:hypothetical protein
MITNFLHRNMFLLHPQIVYKQKLCHPFPYRVIRIRAEYMCTFPAQHLPEFEQWFLLSERMDYLV